MTKTKICVILSILPLSKAYANHQIKVDNQSSFGITTNASKPDHNRNLNLDIAREISETLEAVERRANEMNEKVKEQQENLEKFSVRIDEEKEKLNFLQTQIELLEKEGKQAGAELSQAQCLA